MLKLLHQSFFIFCLLYGGQSLFASNIQQVNDGYITIDKEFKVVNTGRFSSIYRDSSLKKSITEIVNDSSLKYDLVENEIFSEAFNNAVYWIKFNIYNKSDNSKDLILECQNSDVNILQFFIVKNGKLEKEYPETGDYHPFCDRDYNFRFFASKINLKKYEKETIYIKAWFHGEPANIPIKLWNEKSFMESIYNRNLAAGAYFICFIIMIIIALISWAILKLSLNLYYVFYLVSIALFAFSLEGFTYQYLWPSYPIIRNIDQPFFAGLIVISFVLFAYKFLDVKKHMPINHKYYIYMEVLLIVFVSTVPLIMGCSGHILEILQTTQCLSLNA